jgi:uncharacterized membrane protein
MNNTVTATFKDRKSAENALRKLKDIGVESGQVSLIVADAVRDNYFKVEEDNKADEGAATGAAIGGIVGTALSTLTTAGVMVIPGLNLVVAGGLVAALAGLGAGAATGGLIGGLIGAGIPEQTAKIYDSEIKGGSALLAVETRDSNQKRRVQEILESGSAYNVAA